MAAFYSLISITILELYNHIGRALRKGDLVKKCYKILKENLIA